MSQQQPQTDDTVAPARAITDFPDLYPRQVTIHGWKVLHLKDGEPNTAYNVNTLELTCDCQDTQYNKEKAEICKHLAAALEQSPRRAEIGDILTYDLANVVRDARDALKTIERYGTGLQADTAADPTTEEDPTEPEEQQELEAVGSAVRWFKDVTGLEQIPDEVEISLHEQFGSINIHPNYAIEGDQFGAVSGALKEVDNAWWSDEDSCWIIKKEAFDQVF